MMDKEPPYGKALCGWLAGPLTRFKPALFVAGGGALQLNVHLPPRPSCMEPNDEFDNRAISAGEQGTALWGTNKEGEGCYFFVQDCGVVEIA
jgi:hypothetical protein